MKREKTFQREKENAKEAFVKLVTLLKLQQVVNLRTGSAVVKGIE